MASPAGTAVCAAAVADTDGGWRPAEPLPSVWRRMSRTPIQVSAAAATVPGYERVRVSDHLQPDGVRLREISLLPSVGVQGLTLVRCAEDDPTRDCRQVFPESRADRAQHLFEGAETMLHLSVAMPSSASCWRPSSVLLLGVASGAIPGCVCARTGFWWSLD